MVSRVSVRNYTNLASDCDNNNDDHGKIENNYGIATNHLRSSNSYVDNAMIEVNRREFLTASDRIRDADSSEHDEGSNTVDCLDERYKSHLRIPSIGIDDDRSSLESSGSLRNSSNGLTAKDVFPLETARARFLQIIVDNFISEHLIEKHEDYIDDSTEHGVDKMNKRKSGEIQYIGDPRFVMPLMYVANLYETLVNEVNLKLASFNGLREKTIGVALEASGGLYRKLTQKFPKTGSISFKRREMATSMETRKRFPELIVQEEKRIRFVVANGLNIIEKPTEVPSKDAEWFKRLTGRTEVAITSTDYKFYNPRHKTRFKRLTGRTEVAITSTDYKFYNPRHKTRRASLNASPTISSLLSYHSSSDHEFQSASENPGEQVTPPKQHLVTVARHPQYQPILQNHHQSPHQLQSATLMSCSHESGQSSHLRDISHLHESPTLSQSMASVDPLEESHARDRLNMMPSCPAKFCDECGSTYVRPTSKFCSECGTKRFGI